MGNSVEKIGKSLEEAVAMALEELKTDKDNVDIEVIEEGNKGIFGLFGNKGTKVRVSLKESKAEKAKNFLYDILDKMNIKAQIEVFEDDQAVSLDISGDEIGIIIGRRGETLDSLQYLTSLVINKGQDSYKRVVIDVENYRQKREETLVNLANNLADRVIRFKKDITLEPMNPYERRIIHSTLQDNRYVETCSIGDDPNRKVVINLK